MPIDSISYCYIYLYIILSLFVLKYLLLDGEYTY